MVSDYGFVPSKTGGFYVRILDLIPRGEALENFCDPKKLRTIGTSRQVSVSKYDRHLCEILTGPAKGSLATTRNYKKVGKSSVPNSVAAKRKKKNPEELVPAEKLDRAIYAFTKKGWVIKTICDLYAVAPFFIDKKDLVRAMKARMGPVAFARQESENIANQKYVFQ